MSDKVKILIVEHNPDDAELILDELKTAGFNCVTAIVQNEKDYRNAIKNFIPHIILSDYSLPSFNGAAAFKIREAIAPDTPFIFVSGSIGEERSIEYIKNGVTDYVLKDKLFTLAVKVKRALKDAKEKEEKNKTAKALVLSESILARAQELAQLGSWELNFTDNLLTLSAEGCRIFGLQPDQNQLSFDTWKLLVHPEDIENVLEIINASLISLQDTRYQHRIILKDGTIRHINSESKFEFDSNGKPSGMYGIMQDITQRRKSEAAVKKAYEEKNAVLESIDDGFFAINQNSLVTYWNKRAEIMLDIKKEDVIGKNLHDVFSANASKIFYDNYQKAISEKITVHFEGFSKRTGKWFAVSAFGSENGLSVYFKDFTDRKNGEDKLKESELRYRSIIEQATDAICIADSSMKIIDINPFGCQMLGYSKEEFIELSISDLFVAEDLIKDPFKIAELKAGGIIRNERRFKRKDGTLVEIELSARILEDGKFIVFGHDIAERKKADNKIKESELRYRSLNEQATDAICITDPLLKFIDINPYACEVFGYTTEEALQLSLPDILFTEDLADNPLRVAELKLGKTVRNERRLKRKDGTAVDMEVSTKLMEDGRMIMFGHDITNRKKTEQLISESEKKYRQIVETAQEGMWMIDENHKTTFVNNKMCEILEYTRAEMMGKEIYCFMDEEGKKIAAELRKKNNPGITGQEIKKYLSKTGKEIWTNISTNPVFYEDGTYHGSLAMVTDITERLKTEEKVRKLNRLYTFISQVNQNIVHIKDEAELFRNSCQVAFEFGKFKMAWIGIIDKAANKITLADQNGIPIEDIPIFTNANYERNGPVDHVLRTGAYYLCNDIQQDPALQTRKPLAAKRGIQSVIVLPIKKAGNIIGTFNLYAEEVNFFDKEEIALLTEVTEDISFALDLFENAKKQKETEELILNNEKRFRVLIEKSVDMKTLSTPEGKMLYGSASISKFLGYDVDELIGRFAYELVHPDDAMTEKSIQELFDTPGKSIDLQQRMLHKDGHWVWCEGTITNMLHEPGINALVSNFRDISEKKMAEAQKEFDSINLNALINNTTDLMWSVNTDFKLITFNQPFFNVLKLYTGIELTKGDDVFSVALSPEQVNRFKTTYTRAFSGESFMEIEYIAAPIESWSEISYYPIRKGTEVVGTACYSRDITESKKAAINLGQSEERYRQIVETAQEGIWLIDENNKTTFVNKKMCELLEYTEEEMMGRTNLSFKDEDEQKNALQQIERRKEGITEIHEATYLTKSGRTICTQVSTNPLLGDDGSYKGALAMVTDITERKKGEQLLSMQEKRYRALVENGADAVVILTADGKPMYASPTLEKVLGYSEAEALQLDLFSMFHPDDIEWAVKVWEQVMISPGIPVPVRPSRMIHKDGIWRWLEGTVTNLLHDPAVHGIIDNFRDVTAKKELENLLNKTNSLARIGSWEVDVIKGTVYWSDITKEIHEAENDYIPNLQGAINFYKEGESRNLITQKVQDSIEKGLPFDVELEIITVKENEKWIRALGGAEFENGKVVKINGSFQDITDRKHAEIHLNELNENLQRQTKDLAISNADLEQFAYVASHDLQEPLRMVTSFLSQLEKKYGNVIDDKGKKYIAFAVDGAKRMRQIILDLLEFSRVGRSEDNQEDIDLNELVEEIKILFRKQIDDKKAAIISDPLPHIHAHKSPVRQVFQNLISNALKYTRENIAAKIQIKATETATHWQFAITDNGMGIAEEYFDKIFIIFQRLHNKDEFSGTGMGLAVTKKIVENMGGKIWVVSEEGKGSTFYFTLLKRQD